MAPMACDITNRQKKGYFSALARTKASSAHAIQWTGLSYAGASRGWSRAVINSRASSGSCGGVAVHRGLLYAALLDPGYNLYTEETVMKITMNIECPPEEVRRFAGLLDVTVLQEEMMEGFGVKMRESLEATDPEHQ